MGNLPGNVETLSNRIRDGLHYGWYNFWPRMCLVCDQPSANDAVCSVCVAALPRLQQTQHCPVCALPVPGGQVCGACLRRPPALDASRAAFAYAWPVREMLLQAKHGAGLRSHDWLADSLSPLLANWPWPMSALVPMPLHSARLAQRGFNQAAEFARCLGRQHALPVWLESVVRDFDTPKLEGLRRLERQRAMRGVFRCPQRLAQQNIVLVDDVMTSGASLNELARTLKAAGAAHVGAVVVARTLRRAAAR